jgi:hypothetical protein
MELESNNHLKDSIEFKLCPDKSIITSSNGVYSMKDISEAHRSRVAIDGIPTRTRYIERLFNMGTQCDECPREGIGFIQVDFMKNIMDKGDKGFLCVAQNKQDEKEGKLVPLHVVRLGLEDSKEPQVLCGVCMTRLINAMDRSSSI